MWLKYRIDELTGTEDLINLSAVPQAYYAPAEGERIAELTLIVPGRGQVLLAGKDAEMVRSSGMVVLDLDKARIVGEPVKP